MASATIDTCQICANPFNSNFYRSVPLPCGHAFCLICLVRLKASDKCQCPTCRSSWAGYDVPAMHGMYALAKAFQGDKEDGDSCKEKSSVENCNEHSMPYDFWVSSKKEFYCKGCAAVSPPVKLVLIKNAIPQVKADLAVEVQSAKKEVQFHLQSLYKTHVEFVRQRNCVVQFMKTVQALDDKQNQNIDQMAAFISRVLDTAANLKKLKRKVDSIISTADLHVVKDCKSTLEKAAVHISPHIPDLSKTLLFNIACSYVASGKRQCPTCRSSWDGYVVPAMPGMGALANALQEHKEDEDSCEEKNVFDNCTEHSMPYDFWVSIKNEFYCKGCAAENPPVKLELIQNAIPQVKAALAVEVQRAKKEVESHLQSWYKMYAECVRQRNSVVQFMKAVQTLNDNFKTNIDQIAAFRSKVLDTAANLKKLERNVDSIKSTADLHVAVECISTLEKAAVRFSALTPDLSQTLLFNIACNYVEEAETAIHPSMASFVYVILKGSPKPLMEIVRTAETLENGKEWTVDINNCDAVLLAMTDKQPYILNLVERGDGHEALPVAELAKAVKNCAVNVRFVDTFFSASSTAADTEQQKHLLANKSHYLRTFYGHLEPTLIAKLPPTVNKLGLAIGSAADAAAVGGLTRGVELYWMEVSVSSRVAVKDLKPMPDVAYKLLHFPFLADANVNDVRPAIEALVPDIRLMGICFPKCHLTATGVRRLMHHLRGVKVSYYAIIEATGTWRPGSEEMESINKELRSDGLGEVRWNMDKSYS